MKEEKKRLLITVNRQLIDSLNQSARQTNLTKSQLITLCVKRALKQVVKEYQG